MLEKAGALGAECMTGGSMTAFELACDNAVNTYLRGAKLISYGAGCVICMLKIAVIGGRDTVMGFKALGLETYPAADAAEAGRVLKSLTRGSGEYAIIYIEEGFAAELSAEINKFKDSPTPAIILIPGREGSIGLGQSALKAAVERAVGTNILGD